MVVLFIIGIPVAVIVFLWFNQIHIDFKSFLKPTLPLDRGVFGVYTFDGKQGSGKTYSLTKFILRNQGVPDKIYSNMTLNNIDYTPILSVEHLLSLRNEKNIYIIYDEILNLLNDSKIPRDIRDQLMEFLTQQRKMKNILFTTTQEWLNVPIEFRRFVRILITCTTRPLGRFGGILREEYSDAYNMKWSQIDNEYVAPRISLKFSKYEKSVMMSYDTFERVHKLNRS